MAKNCPIRYFPRNDGERRLTTKLHVHRLPVSTTDSELQRLFEGVGRVVNCDLVTDGTTRMSKAIGFVESARISE
jgi:RNA recognition motif-containing protein